MFSKKSNTYKPKWNVAESKWTKYANNGGKGYSESIRHRKALRKAIHEYEVDPVVRKRLLKYTASSQALQLDYLNPTSRLRWCGAAVESFCSIQPKGPFLTFTVINEDWNGTTNETSPTTVAPLEAVRSVFEELGASSYAHVEFAVFPKVAESGVYKIAPHVQGLAWDVSRKALKAALKKQFPPLADGTPGYCVKRVHRTIWNVISYATKAPAYGYSGWPTSRDRNEHKSVEIPLQGHFQLLHLFTGIKWPDLIIATGEGKNVLRGMLEVLGLGNGSPTCPPADKSGQKDDEEFGEKLTIGDMPLVTLETKVDANRLTGVTEMTLQERHASACLSYQAYRGQLQQTRSAHYRFLDDVFTTALVYTKRKIELQKLLVTNSTRYDQRADAFLLALKLTIPEDKYNRRRASDWAAALRYLYAQGCKAGEVPTYLTRLGGLRICARAVAAAETTPTNDNGPAADASWNIITKHGRKFSVVTNQLDMPFSKGVLIAARNKDKNRLLVRHAINANDAQGRTILRLIAKYLNAKSKKRRA